MVGHRFLVVIDVAKALEIPSAIALVYRVCAVVAPRQRGIGSGRRAAQIRMHPVGVQPVLVIEVAVAIAGAE